ncbi:MULTISPECIES: hypothetical protein [unclassified Streptomyces]|uniref:hypothetical protein n=1 Tax=unclassified Streptomyces TaxID=2593676 RepID=UPI00336A8091
MVVAPNGRRAYVSVDGAGSVQVIDIATDRVTATVPGLNVPNRLAAPPHRSVAARRPGGRRQRGRAQR